MITRVAFATKSGPFNLQKFANDGDDCLFQSPGVASTETEFPELFPRETEFPECSRPETRSTESFRPETEFLECSPATTGPIGRMVLLQSINLPVLEGKDVVSRMTMSTLL